MEIVNLLLIIGLIVAFACYVKSPALFKSLICDFKRIARKFRDLLLKKIDEVE